MDAEIEELPARRASDEEVFYLQKAREEFFRSLERIEETAKYVIGAVGAVAGLFLAGMQVKLAVNPKLPQASLKLPFLLWGISLILAVLVFFPFPYRSVYRSPQQIRRAFSRARRVKWGLLPVMDLSLHKKVFRPGTNYLPALVWFFI